ncbi:peptidoglycan editing factor PgeF [Salipaludibacillus sp. LMS25]|jgi:YfiH family protein|uniref:peptidoglycan editing factor PgeF n=1 Tax=Salipaludibacillus sp. LMS25 TaxID=2924031 RepID=UPI0020D1931F|nr:peptidoglycan editing factor PgeF [Salipaludibacillus sp. LMS25]UTR14167.1 peptidoglycan editing factor PgeF [Salipaludibacillus sp. LMS25]
MTTEPFQLQSDALTMLQDWGNLSPHVLAGFTTKHGGTSSGPFTSNNLGLHVNDTELHVRENRRRLADSLQFPIETWACADQVHEDHIVKISRDLTGYGALNYNDSIKGTDGFYTTDKDILLTLCYADCVPIYYVAPEHHTIGIAHAGWKGSVKNIAGKMVQLWKLNESIPTANVHVAIGPSIGKCCYKVDDRVITEVDNILSSSDTFDSPYQKVSDGQYSLDLKKLNLLLLLNAGIDRANILVSQYCTSCEKNLFFSHRRDKGKTGRMLSFIGFKS